MNAFKYGAPPHGGLAYGLDRWYLSLPDWIVFVTASHSPKNNSGRDVMLDAPAAF